MSDILNESIEALKIASKSSNYLYAQEIQEVEDALKHYKDYNTFKIAVIGEFSVGKSTFLNALIGKRLLYSAAQEATGVAVEITNSNKKVATVYGDISSEIDLNNKDAYEKLIPYVNRDNKINNEVQGIHIEYPIKALGKNVSILDTPGLQGLGDREVKIARKALSESNATIIIIEPKGFTGHELDLLKGNLPGFDKIKSKKSIILINKIGSFFDNYPREKAIEKIEKCKLSVKDELAKNDINDIEIFAVDSRDYLWAVDNDLYNESKNVNKDVLTQEEYRERSGFEEFLKYIEKFLNSDNKSKIVEKEIRENLLILFKEFEEVFNGNNNILKQMLEKEINNIIFQKRLLVENRRKVINETRRQLVSTVSDFKEILEDDIDSDNKEEKRKIRKEIELINELSDFNEDKEKELLNLLNQDVSNYLNHYKKTADAYKKEIIKKVKETFEKSIKVNLKIELNINFFCENLNVEIDENIVSRSTLDKSEGRLEKKKKELKEAIIKLKEDESSLNCKKNNLKSLSYKMDLERRLRNLKYDIDKEILELGPRPEPRRKYRTVYKTKGFWIFKKEVSEEVFDGYDYSECEEWDYSKEGIYKKYERIEKNLSKELSNIEKEEREIKSKEEEFEINRRYIKTLEKEVNSLEKEIIELRKDNDMITNMYIGKMQGQLYEAISAVLNDYFKEIKRILRDRFDSFEKVLGEKVHDQAQRYLEKYEKELNKKYEEINSKIRELRNKDKFDLNNIIEFKEKLVVMEE
ncbi:dynamin family protein [Clostridium perfringens]|nr:dynamin family protein [Clostridium perfringens]